MASISRAELFRLLEERLRDPAITAEQDRAIWDAHAVDRAILVIDLSGFTRLTRTRGILHFLTVYRRACSIALPAIRDGGGRLVKCEADNVLATFDSAADALAAAKTIVLRTSALDATLAQDEHVVVCIAIGFGKFIELTDDIFGDEVNVTFKLGEDIARGREILLTDGAHAKVDVACEERSIEVGGVRVRYFAVAR